VPLDRRHADDQLLGDLLVGHARGEKFEESERVDCSAFVVFGETARNEHARQSDVVELALVVDIILRGQAMRTSPIERLR